MQLGGAMGLMIGALREAAVRHAAPGSRRDARLRESCSQGLTSPELWGSGLLHD